MKTKGLMIVPFYSRKISILCLTRPGAELAVGLSRELEGCRVYIPLGLKMFYSCKSVTYYKHWSAIFEEAFQNSTYLICIMTADTVVRSMAPLLASGFHNPAVVVVDEEGNNVISLLSDIGGNLLSRKIAAITGGRAIITTASDASNKKAVDILPLETDRSLDPLSSISLSEVNRLSKRYNVKRCLP